MGVVPGPVIGFFDDVLDLFELQSELLLMPGLFLGILHQAGHAGLVEGDKLLFPAIAG